MKGIHRWLVVGLLAACVQPVGCKKAAESAEEEPKAAEVEHLDGAEPTRVKLTEEAAKRLDIKTAEVRDEKVDGKQRKVVPYDAILYDTEGGTWVYTNAEALTYVRHAVTVDRIVGDLALLSDGPPPGTPVVTVGAAELYGSEIEFEEE